MTTLTAPANHKPSLFIWLADIAQVLEDCLLEEVESFELSERLSDLLIQFARIRATSAITRFHRYDAVPLVLLGIPLQLCISYRAGSFTIALSGQLPSHRKAAETFADVILDPVDDTHVSVTCFPSRVPSIVRSILGSTYTFPIL